MPQSLRWSQQGFIEIHWVERQIRPNKGDEWRAAGRQLQADQWADRLFTVADRVIYHGWYFSDTLLATFVLCSVSQRGCNPLLFFFSLLLMLQYLQWNILIKANIIRHCLSVQGNSLCNLLSFQGLFELWNFIMFLQHWFCLFNPISYFLNYIN